MKKIGSRLLTPALLTILILSLFTSGSVLGATTTAPVAKDYKDVVLIQAQNDVWFSQLSAEGYIGGQEYNDQPGLHSFSIWREIPVKYTDTDPTMIALNKKALSQAPRYFRVNLTKAQKSGKDATKNFAAATKAGQAPLVLLLPGPDKTTATIKNIPATSKKIIINYFNDGYFNSSSKRNVDKFSTKLVTELTNMVNAIHKAVPKAQIYLACMPMQSAKFPRFDNIDVMTRWGGLLGVLQGMGTFINMKDFKDAVNSKIEAYCTKNKFVFVDWRKAGVTDSNNCLLEECVLPQSAGGHLNQTGATRVGDYMCKIMGLPTAKQMYKLK